MKLNLKEHLAMLFLIFCGICLTSCSKDSDLLSDYVINDTDIAIENLVVDDLYTINSFDSIVLDVLENDNFDTNSTVTIVKTSTPISGKVTINEDNTLTYTPADPESTPTDNSEEETTDTTEQEEDTFTYTTEETNEDGETTTEDGTVTISPEPTADFTYNSFTEAYANAGNWTDNAKIKIDNLQGGFFTYTSNNDNEEDGGLIFKVNAEQGFLIRDWNEDGTVKAEWFGMIPNNEKYDNELSMQNLLQIKAKYDDKFDTVLFDGKYNFDNTVDIPSLKNLTLKGIEQNNRAEFTSQNQYILFTTGFYERLEDFSLINIKTSSYMIDNLDANRGNSATLWAFGEGGGTNHLIQNCEFTAPEVFTNGFKYYGDTPNDYENIIFKDCHFHDFGRFALEIFGTRQENYDPENAAVKNVVIDGGIVERSGLIGHLGVSIVQSVKDVIVKNVVFRDNRSSLELGATNVKVFNNEFYGEDNAISFGGIYDSFENPIFYQKNYEIYNNRGNVSGGLSMIIVEDLNFHDNDWTFNNSFYFNNVNNVSFTNENIKIRGYTNWNGGTLIPTLQFFNSVSGIQFNDSRYEFLNSSSFSSNGQYVELTDTEIHVQDIKDFNINSARKLTNIKVLKDNVLLSTLNN